MQGPKTAGKLRLILAAFLVLCLAVFISMILAHVSFLLGKDSPRQHNSQTIISLAVWNFLE